MKQADLRRLLRRMDVGSSPGDRSAGSAAPGDESQCLSGSLLENVPGLVYRRRNDNAGTFLFASAGVRELTEHEPSALTRAPGASFFSLIDPSDRTRVTSEIAAALGEGRNFEVQYRLRTATGRTKWVSDRGGAVRRPGGEIHVIEGFISDITLLRQAELTIGERDDCFSLAFNSARDMMVLARVEPGPVFRVVAINRSYEVAMLGNGLDVTNADMAGKTYDEVRVLLRLTDADWHPLLARYHEVVRTGKPMRFQEIAETPAGRFCGDSTITPVTDATGCCRFVLYSSTDVSAQFRVERELRESADKFAKAFHASPGAMSISEPRGRGFLAVNDNYVRMFGYAREELLGKSLSDLGLWGDEEQKEKFTEAFSISGSIREMEVVRRRRDGRLITCLLSAESIELDGNPCIIASLYDITERRRAEQSLRESEERFSKAFRATPDAVLITDRETGRVVDANEGCERVYGYSRAECIGRTALELGVWENPEDRARFIAAVQAGNGSVRDLQVAGRTRSGAILTVLASCETIELGGRPHLVTIAHDITEQKAAERALRESEARFSTAFRASPGAMSITDLDLRRFVDVNDGFCQLFGYTREEMLGRNGNELGLWPGETIRDTFFSDLERHGVVHDLEVVTKSRDGQPVVYLVSGRTVSLGGRDHVITMVHDITARRQAEAARRALEEQLRQTQKLEALGQLAGGIAHDFNNILTGIVAYTDLALLDVEQPDEVRKHLGFVRKASDRATDLVRQILTFSRRQPQERVPIRLGGIVSEAMKLIRSSIPSTVEMIERIDPRAPVVLADKSQVHQIVMNLCANAAHAMRGTHGSLTVSLEETNLAEPLVERGRQLSPGRYARLSVVDTGSGMDDATLARIFEPFFTTKGPGEGTGLGLAVVHGIVENHQGAIVVRSCPGKGTQISVYLPQHAAPAAEETNALLALPRGRGERVLFIDDETTIIASASVLLGRLGYRITPFTDPREAWATFSAEPHAFDAVVTDMTMPHLTGTDLVVRILQLRPGLPIMLTTGHSGKWTSEALHGLGVKSVLAKPITMAVFAQAMRDLFDAPKA